MNFPPAPVILDTRHLRPLIACLPHWLQSRRASLLLGGSSLAAAAVLLASGPPAARAAYGDPANVFGKPPRKSDFIPYKGDGFTVELPSKYVPSAEQEHPGTVLRYGGG